MNKKIILASTSPRRKALLEKTGLTFETFAPNYTEDLTLPLPPRELVQSLSKGKAQAAVSDNPNAIIIAADTVVALGNSVLGKPNDEKIARTMLNLLSGTTHSVFTGVTVLDSTTSESASTVVETRIHVKHLTPTMIEEYIATGEGLDKAGAYGIQGRGQELIENVDGDIDAVIGLPIAATLELLKKSTLSIV